MLDLFLLGCIRKVVVRTVREASLDCGRGIANHLCQLKADDESIAERRLVEHGSQPSFGDLSLGMILNATCEHPSGNLYQGCPFF